MNKHTPGPWMLDGDAGSMSLDVIARSERIAMIDCEVCRMEDSEVDANGLLIAAAPDLLDALSTLLRAATEARWPLVGEQMAPMNMARAAIAKATGES